MAASKQKVFKIFQKYFPKEVIHKCLTEKLF